MADPSSDDLDQLLDSALDDFTKLDLAPAQRSGGGGEGKEGRDALPSSSSSPSASSASAPPVRGLGMGLPDLAAKRKGKQGARPRGSHASEALEKLTKETREAVRGLESATGAATLKGGDAGFDKEGMVDEFVKQFEELAGSQDVESIVETMMQQLLSKEILYEPMKEIGERYPKWLEEHKDTLKKKMQECGQPPSDIVQELAPDLDLSNLGQLSPDQLDATSNCCIIGVFKAEHRVSGIKQPSESAEVPRRT